MFRKPLLVLFCVIFPIYVLNENANVPKRKMSFVRQVPSSIMGIFSLCVLSGQKRKMFYVFLTALFLTVDLAIPYVYYHDSRQKSYGSPYMKRLPNVTKSARVDDKACVDDTGKEATFNAECNGLKTQELHDGFNIYDVLRNGPIYLSGVKKNKHSCSPLSRTLKGNQGSLPWYLDQENTVHRNSTYHVYPFTLNHYFDEVLQNNPRSVLMKYEWARFASFDRFPLDSPARPLRLAQSGFYYNGSGDSVECFSCNTTYGSWKEGDEPSSIHKQISPHCAFVTGEDRTNVPIHENQGLPVPRSEPEAMAVAVPTTVSTDGAAVKTDTSNIEVKQHCAFGGKDDYLFRGRGAKHPDYVDPQKRLESFKDWPCGHIVSREDLVAAGFAYAGVGDCVRCFYCGLGLRNWEAGDGPWEEHARWAQHCQYVLKKKGEQFVRQHATEADNEPCPRQKPAASSSTSNIPKQQAFNDVPAKTNVVKKKDTNQSTYKTSSVKTKTSDLVKQQKQHSINNTQNPKYPASLPDLKQDAKQIKDENTQLKSQLTCKVCMDRETNTVVLPCGHFVSCFSCSQNLRKCAICRTKIEARVKVFMS